MSDLKTMIESGPDSADAAFDTLAADADGATRQLLAESLAPKIAKHIADFP